MLAVDMAAECSSLRLIETGDTLIHTGADSPEEMGVLIIEILIHDFRVSLLVGFLHLLYEFREVLGYCLDVLGGERELHFMGRHAHLGIATLGSTLANLIFVCLVERPDVDSQFSLSFTWTIL